MTATPSAVRSRPGDLMLYIINEAHYTLLVIKTFADKSTKEFWDTGKSQRMPPANLRKASRKKLAMLNSAATLDDLRIPRGNRLEELQHDRRGQHSIAINDQFRVCFVWRDGDAYDVEITDYH